jgi:hypothetical protein
MSASQMLVSMTRADLEKLVQSAVQLALSNSSLQLPAAVAAGAKKAKKEKKVKDPLAPKKDPNAWVSFTQHVRSVLLAAGCELKGFVGQQYCSVLKAKLPLLDANEKGKQEPDYSAIAAADIVSGFKSWTPPEQSKAAVAKASKPPSAEVSPVPAAPAAPAVPSAEKKTRKPQSEETKAAAALKRAATKAAKAVAGGEAVVPPKPTGPKPATAAAPKPVAAAPPAAAEEDEDVTSFAPTIIKGKPYIRNCRGDVMTEEYEWVGRYNETTKMIDTKFLQPEDLVE